MSGWEIRRTLKVNGEEREVVFRAADNPQYAWASEGGMAGLLDTMLALHSDPAPLRADDYIVQANDGTGLYVAQIERTK